MKKNKKKLPEGAPTQKAIFKEIVIMGNNDEQEITVCVEFKNVKAESLGAAWDIADKIFKKWREAFAD